MRSVAACMSIAVLVGSMDALAQASARTPVDPAGKGAISYEDYVHRSAARALGDMDRDRNQRLSADEVRSAGVSAIEQRNLAIRFQEADLDRDGSLSLDELKSALRNHPGMRSAFDAYDVDGDGMLSGAEQEAVRAPRQLNIEF